MWKIPLFDLNYDEKEEQAVVEVLRSKWLSMGPKTNEFEEAFSLYNGGNVKCLGVSNGSSALFMALKASNVMPGDEVLLSGLTFIADLNMIIGAGAVPVVCDSKSLQDWNISVEDIKKKITRKTKAIIIVHYGG